jgi:mannose-1-phosphate guanylyltransferase/mannose-6-phosphate isomerase
MEARTGRLRHSRADIAVMDETNPPIVPVVLSGGSGTRLWPASREHRPKQLLPLLGAGTMLHATIDRVRRLPGVEPPIVVTNAEHAIAVERTLREEGVVDPLLILEPVGRNTAPAIAAAAHVARSPDGDPLLLVLPADHVITDTVGFGEAVTTARKAAEEGAIVTFGITPSHAETGYGYIRAGESLDGRLRSVVQFEEKPDRQTAERYVASGDYSWNSGMFLVQASTYLTELATHRPDIASAVKEALDRSNTDGRVTTLDPEAFAACPGESIDYAVMEHTDHAAVIPIDVGWSDVGSWASLWSILERDESGNATRGDVVTVDTSDSLVLGDARLLAVAGLEGVAVVDTPDAILVTSLDAAQSVKTIVERLGTANRREIESDGTQIESWGASSPVSTGAGHIVRDLVVDAGAAIPERRDPGTVHLQVIAGSADLHRDGVGRHIATGASEMIPPGVAWSIENTSDSPLRVTMIHVDTHLEISRDPGSASTRRRT